MLPEPIDNRVVLRVCALHPVPRLLYKTFDVHERLFRCVHQNGHVELHRRVCVNRRCRWWTSRIVGSHPGSKPLPKTWYRLTFNVKSKKRLRSTSSLHRTKQSQLMQACRRR
jgi:hypothetical protein